LIRENAGAFHFARIVSAGFLSVRSLFNGIFVRVAPRSFLSKKGDKTPRADRMPGGTVSPARSRIPEEKRDFQTGGKTAFRHPLAALSPLCLPV